jgi:membrane-bound lytic murein transglycosylase D
MKIPCTFTLLMLAMLLSMNGLKATNFEPYGPDDRADLLDAEVEQRLAQLSLPVSNVSNPLVKTYIRRYITHGYQDSEAMLGRSGLYFPIFEHYLRQNNMPEELKYLPIVESSLRPDAVSTAGATGLWQLMGPTARELGLQVDATIDERRDPNRSTEAAVLYLQNLYERFQSWELALAAYNCGPGNVLKAIRASGSRDYWQLMHLLPKETQQYVPRYIAASYLAEYYAEHSLSPTPLDYEMQFTRTIRVFSKTTFKQLASITGFSERTFSRLNPAYQYGYVPASSKGYLLILPEMAVTRLRDFLSWTGSKQLVTDLHLNSGTERVNRHGVRTLVRVGVGQSISNMAALYECTPEQLRSWNGLQEDAILYYRQELVVYVKEQAGTPKA